MSRTGDLTGQGNRVTHRDKARAVTGIGQRVEQAKLQNKAIRESGGVRRVWPSAHAPRLLARGSVRGTALA